MLISTKHHGCCGIYLRHYVVTIPRKADEVCVWPGCYRYGTDCVRSIAAESIPGLFDAIKNHSLVDIVFESEDSCVLTFNGTTYGLAFILTNNLFFDGLKDDYGEFESGIIAPFLDDLGSFTADEGDLCLRDWWELNIEVCSGATYIRFPVVQFLHKFSYDGTKQEEVTRSILVHSSNGVKQEANA